MTDELIAYLPTTREINVIKIDEKIPFSTMDEGLKLVTRTKYLQQEKRIR